MVFTPVLDDRLGAYVILDYLSQIKGLKYDFLLTTGEEKASSTGKIFKSKKQYNWLVEFDRRGTDVVTYRYDGDGFDALLKDYFIVGNGSFSDISGMQHLGAKAFNVGIGYHDEHAINSFCRLDEFRLQMARFIRFYRDFKDKALPHVEKKPVVTEYVYEGGYLHQKSGHYQSNTATGIHYANGYYPYGSPNEYPNCGRPVVANGVERRWVDNKGWVSLHEQIVMLQEEIDETTKLDYCFVHIPWENHGVSNYVTLAEAQKMLKELQAKALVNTYSESTNGGKKRDPKAGKGKTGIPSSKDLEDLSGDPIHKCEYCDEKFPLSDALMSDKGWICPDCGMPVRREEKDTVDLAEDYCTSCEKTVLSVREDIGDYCTTFCSECGEILRQVEKGGEIAGIAEL